MKKQLRKLILAVCSLLLSVVMLVTVSYAWMTLSDSPVAEGIQVTISGGSVLMIAPDMTETVDGNTVHYPGKFTSTLQFHNSESYAYLNDVSALSPVSTSDGLRWFIPEYYNAYSPEVISGEVAAGSLKDISEFTEDNFLEYANMTDAEYKEKGRGGYVSLDFWIVSPASDYTLRISRGDSVNGSFVLELLDPAKESDGGYTLNATAGYAAASARVGFLVNEDIATDATMMQYQKSFLYDSTYTRLKGAYQEKGGAFWESPTTNFTIYEPNADLHPDGDASYVVTNPIGYENGKLTYTDIRDRLTVQRTNSWKAATASQASISDLFSAAVYGKSFEDSLAVQNYFYKSYLQGQFMTYVDKGEFIKKTGDLYDSLSEGKLDAESFASAEGAGATDDVVIVELEKNVPQRIRMFVWLEGEDVDCVNGAAACNFVLSIEFAGSNIKKDD
ncbi:MAG: hypothetical protein IKM46_02325 [Clostridia bacterium]|nr:hypothetical protein [Clostridia bacterium]